MADLELVLASSTAVLAVTLIVSLGVLARYRRRIEDLERRADRQKRVTSPVGAVRTVVETAMKVKDHGFSGALRSSIEDLAQWADVERPDLARIAAADGTVTILFSDIEGSTALNHQLGDRGWVQLLSKHDRLLHRAIGAHSGHVIKTQGDGFMVAFAEASQAVASAFDIQRSLAKARPGSKLSGVRVRIGAHRGSAVHRDGDLFGRNVAYAARVAAQADGREVLVSDTVLDVLADNSIQVLDSREAELKGVPGTHWLHALDWRA